MFATWMANYIDDIPTIYLDAFCKDGYMESCHINQMIYRTSVACSICLSVIAVGSYCWTPMHTGFWSAKYIAVFLLMLWFLFLGNEFFDKFANTARYLSLAWLSIQSLLVMEIAMSTDDKFKEQMDTEEAGPEKQISKTTKASYLLIVLACATGGIVGTVYLYKDYTGCTLGMWLVTLTLSLNIGSTFVSNYVGMWHGITNMAMWAYTTFLCWYALLSSTSESCNPTADEALLYSSRKESATTIVLMVTVMCVGWAGWLGKDILTILFDTDEREVTSAQASVAQRHNENLSSLLAGETPKPEAQTEQPAKADTSSEGNQSEGQTSSNSQEQNCCAKCCGGMCTCCADSASTPTNIGESKEELVFFHLLLVLTCIYCTMTLTSWGRVDGAPDSVGNGTEPDISLWIKVVAQWSTFIFFGLIIRKFYNDDQTLEEDEKCLFACERDDGP